MTSPAELPCDEIAPVLNAQAIADRYDGGHLFLAPHRRFDPLVADPGRAAHVDARIGLRRRPARLIEHRVRHRPSRCASGRLARPVQRKRTSNVARPKILRPSDFAPTTTTPVRVSGFNDLTRPLNSMSVPAAADTTAGADNRTA